MRCLVCSCLNDVWLSIFICLANERRATRISKMAPVHLDISFTNSFTRGGELASILHFRRLQAVIFSVKQIPHPSSDIFSWLTSVLISHYLCSVTDHNSSHTHTHNHAALTLARSLIFCGDGSAELADIFNLPQSSKVQRIS